MPTTIPNLTLPGHLRYQPKSLVDYFGYDNLYRTVGQVELATIRTLIEIGVIAEDHLGLLTAEVERSILALSTTSIDEVERKVTRHDIRAWVKLAKELMPEKLRRWVHIPLTSYDAIDTSRVLQYSLAHRQAVNPAIREVISLLADKVEKYADTPQIGRTHGQHALPITVGFWLATILNRLLVNTREMDRYCDGLVGKISGAVGAYNAQVGLGISERCGEETFEMRVLSKLGLKPAVISNQILPPENLSFFLYAYVSMSGAFGQLGRDGRNLMRTEIGEIGEPFEKGQAGSSTMAQKRNPVTFENQESMWKKNIGEFVKVLFDAVSEHQRDLTGSALSRDFPIIVVNVTNQLDALLRKGPSGASFLERISVDEEALKRNLAMQGNIILGEPMYIALEMAGYEKDAHDFVNHQLVPRAKKENVTLMDALEEEAVADMSLQQVVDKIPRGIQNLLRCPEKYVGASQDKALQIVSLARGYVANN